MKTTVLDVLQRLFGPNLSAKWKILVLFLTISFVWSLMRRGRWSRQRTAVNTVAQTIGFVPLDELPIPRDELKSFELPLGLGKLHNIIGGSVDGNEAVLFDTEVGHTHGEPTLQTIAAFKLTGSNLPNFNLRPRSVASKVLSLFGKGIEFGDDSPFSRDYFLTSVDEQDLRACFTAEFRKFFEGLEQFDSVKNWHMQRRGDWVIVYRKDEGFAPDELQTFLEGTSEIFRNLKVHPGKVDWRNVAILFAEASTGETAMTKEEAWNLANHWVAAWNSHDLDLIMTHYDDAIELTSPVAARLLGTSDGKVVGKANLRAYFQRGLEAYPELHFRLENVLWGVNSVLLYYTNQKGTHTVEFMELSATGKIARVVANYSA